MRFEHLTGARCLAALWILCAHYLPRGPQEAEQVRALYRVDVAVCFFVVASGFVTHWSAKLEDLSCSKLVRYYVRRLGRVLLSYWLALLWHVLLLRRQQALDLGYVLRCACFLEQWLRWCPNGPSWFVFALLPSWLLYPWSRKLVQVAEEHGVPGLLALAFILSAASIGPAVYLLAFKGSISMQQHADMTFWPPAQMADFLLGVTSAAMVPHLKAHRLWPLADLSLLLIVLVVFLLPRPETTWALHLNGWEPILDHGPAPLIASFLVASSNESPGWAAKLLAHPALVSLGSVSFEVYIFQRPMYDTWSLLDMGDQMDVFMAYLFSVWLFAFLYKHFLEDPVDRCLRQWVEPKPLEYAPVA